MAKTKVQQYSAWSPHIQDKSSQKITPPIVVESSSMPGIVQEQTELETEQDISIPENWVSNHPLMRGQALPIQPKLTIGQPNDQYEQEADRVAREVVQKINSSETPLPSHDGDNNSIQRKQQVSTIQRVEDNQEELQMKMATSAIQAKADKINIQTDFESNLNNARNGGSPLDSNFQSQVEVAMGADFSTVKVHTDSTANDLSRSIQAKAFATGNDIFFQQGTYDPYSRGGQELLAHELTHVVQQMGAGQRTRDNYNSIDQKVPRKDIFWGSTRAANQSSFWETSQAITRPNLFAKRAIEVSEHSITNTSPDIQRYKTSAGFFGNKVTFESSALGATLAQPLSIQQSATGVSVSSQAYNASGTVKASGPKGRVKEYEVGFLQTVYDSRRSFYYQPEPYTPGLLQQIGTAIMPAVFGDRLQITDLCDPLPVRDGDTGILPWYGMETVKSFDEAPVSTKTASMYDKPGTATMPWTQTVNGKTQNLIKTRGQDVFRSWLSVQEKGTTGFFGMHRLGYIDWKVDYGTDITYKKANPASSVVTPIANSGGKIIGINEGPGIKFPLMGDPTANDAAKDVKSNW